MDQPKYREKVLIGLESAPPSFDVRGKVMGPNGANLRYITNETGATVTIRGKGSGFIEANTGQESPEPLHICVEHSKYEVLQACRQLAFNLIETVQQEWTNFQQQPQQQQNEPQQNYLQSIPLQSELEANGAAAGTQANGKLVASGGGLQLQLPLYNPPPSLTVPPPPIHISQPSIQVSVGGSQTSQSQMTAGEGSMVPVAAGSQPPPQQQAPPSTAELQQAHQLQLQTQQVYVSQGNGLMQPATLIPQQQLQQTASLLAATQQPQIITQASYPIQYMQNGQMVLAYPNVVRPVAAPTGQQQTQQVMLVQYTPQRPSVVQGRTATQNTIPQIVQILNPQTGQYQHVLQHVQPQIQMQQLALDQGVGNNMMGGGVLMPVQQQQQQGQQQLVQQAIQFAQPGTGTPAQGMIITTQQPSNQQQIAVSQANLQLQQQGERSSPASQMQQQTVGLQQQARPQQGVKRRFESGPPVPVPPPTLQNMFPPPQALQSSVTLQSLRKGMGPEGVQQIVRPTLPPQQAPPNQQQLPQHLIQQQFVQQQFAQHPHQLVQQQQHLVPQPQQHHLVQQQQPQHMLPQQQHMVAQQQPQHLVPQQQQAQQMPDEGQQDLDKSAQSHLTTDEVKPEQAKRGRPAQNADGVPESSKGTKLVDNSKVGNSTPGATGEANQQPHQQQVASQQPHQQQQQVGNQQQGGYQHQQPQPQGGYQQQQQPAPPNYSMYNAPPPFHHAYGAWTMPQ